MTTSLLLSNVRHRAMTMPVSTLRKELSIGLDSKSNVLCKYIASKNVQSNMNHALKNT